MHFEACYDRFVFISAELFEEQRHDFIVRNLDCLFRDKCMSFTRQLIQNALISFICYNGRAEDFRILGKI